MMKSFFKKLSLVMALAMVVSLVAPAGSAFAATAGIALQGTTTTVDAINVEVGGEVVDLCFLGAPADWKSTYEWTPGDATIASVDKAGKVTGLKAGETTVTITAGADASYKHTVKVTVKEAKTGFEIEQKSDSRVDFIFDKAVSYTKDDIELFMIYTSANGDEIEVSWPVKEAKLTDDKKTVMVTPYINFSDGDRYLVKVGNYEAQGFITTIGEVTDVVVTFESFGSKVFAYTNGLEGEPVDTVLSYKLMSGKVDVTNVYKNSGYVEFELLQPSEDNDYVVLQSEGILNFYQANTAAVVSAKYSFEQDGELVSVSSQKPTQIVCKQVPTYDVLAVEEWTVYAAEGFDGSKFDWKSPNHSVPADDAGMMIVAVLSDNRGNYYVTDNRFVGEKYNNKDVAYVGNATKEFNMSGYRVEFNSTDTDKFLVGADGALETYTKVNRAIVYVSLFNENLESDNKFVKHISVLPLEIKDKRALDKVVVDKPSVTLVTDELDKPDYNGEFTKTEITVSTKDQYNDACANGGFEITTTNVDLADKVDTILEFDGSTITVDAEKMNAETAASVVTFTVKENWTGKKATFKVYLRDPRYCKNDKGEVIENPNAAGETIDFNSWNVTATDVDNAAVLGWPKYENKDEIVKTVDLSVNKLSNSYAVGRYHDIKICTDANQVKFTKDSTVAVGERYLIVTDSKGNVVKATDAASSNGLGINLDQLANGKIQIVTACSEDEDEGTQKINYMPNDKYTVKVYLITGINNSTKVPTYTTKTATFTVSNTSPTVTFIDMKDVKTTTPVNEDNIKSIVVALCKFNLGGNEWTKLTTDMIEKVTAKYEGNYVIIQSVLFNVPVDGESTSANYYDVEVKNINKSVRYVVE